MTKRLIGGICLILLFLSGQTTIAQTSLVHFADHVVMIKAHNGKFLSVDDDGNVSATADTPGAREFFYLKRMGEDKLALMAWTAKWVTADANGGIRASERVEGDAQTFDFLWQREWYQFAFRSAFGLHLTVPEGASVKATPPWVGSWEKFEVHRVPDHMQYFSSIRCMMARNCVLPAVGQPQNIYDSRVGCIMTMIEPKTCYVPDGPGSQYRRTLAVPCSEQDTCYGTPGETKESCDQKLKVSLVQRCAGDSFCQQIANKLYLRRTQSLEANELWNGKGRRIREEICSGWK